MGDQRWPIFVSNDVFEGSTAGGRPSTACDCGGTSGSLRRYTGSPRCYTEPLGGTELGRAPSDAAHLWSREADDDTPTLNMRGDYTRTLGIIGAVSTERFGRDDSDAQCTARGSQEIGWVVEFLPSVTVARAKSETLTRAHTEQGMQRKMQVTYAF